MQNFKHDTGSPKMSDIASQELQELRERLSELTRHSLRTPLTVIDGNARRLERFAGQVSAEEVKARTEIIRATVDKMVELVEHSIELTQMAACIKPDPVMNVMLHELVEGITREHQAVRPDVNLVAWLTECPDLVVGDRRLVELILDKLLTIGGDLITNRGRLDLVMWSEGRWANITLKAIFEARSLVDVRDLSEKLEADRNQATTVLPDGVNLKLIRLLVEQHEGELDIEDCEDRIEFEIRLPITGHDEECEKPLLYMPKDNSDSQKEGTVK
ncbi:histidine kinase dimerization/phospho-acceptor domain-containing protein [Ponticaulis sp.]|uniref:sensor histidine kinase n=1 Tax=Ponticaulis sp. TaxID=2020902 RepID=UPI000C3962B6|nr:histidine kinase dimerization/phospho-acceptor domain-containing protein [Ponticaulis sp.]MAF57866.1 hypothetical protein [Ponticaulis sp.]MBN03799.1 hypothetical protein [Ponticaulis sp.]|tara:strand:- start:112 stop:930 length:819 start_codon:yes stop_codon:yes gene_type:complete